MPARQDPVPPVADPDADRPREAGHPDSRRERARRRALRRRRGVAGLALACLIAAAVAILALGSSGAGPRPAADVGRAAGARGAGGVARTPAAPSRAPRTAGPARPPAPSPGSLPQTHAYPSGTSARFKSLIASLWAGIVRGSVAPALAAFFPKAAYLQLKAIGSANSDWSGRLVRDYGLDIYAANQLLGADAARARLIRVDVPSSYGHWIAPGVCYNDVGYYEMPNARVVYRENGAVRSFGIASMISWRGVWYVVHLGAILRQTDSGTVDEPASGPGSPAYSGTC